MSDSNETIDNSVYSGDYSDVLSAIHENQLQQIEQAETLIEQNNTIIEQNQQIFQINSYIFIVAVAFVLGSIIHKVLSVIDGA